MEDQIISRHFDIASEAFLQVMSLYASIITAVALIALAITLIGLVWLTFNERRSKAGKKETVETTPAAPAFGASGRFTFERNYLAASIPQPDSFRGGTARR
jgi:hypothetical protein